MQFSALKNISSEFVRDFSISWGQRHLPDLFRSCWASLRCPFKDIMPWSWSTSSRRSSPQNSSWSNKRPMNWGIFIEDGGGRVFLFDTPNVKWYVLIIWIIWNILELLKFWKMNLVSRCQKKGSTWANWDHLDFSRGNILWNIMSYESYSTSLIMVAFSSPFLGTKAFLYPLVN